MIIETKFNLGDTVYFIDGTTIREKKIHQISVRVNEDQKLILYYESVGRDFREEVLFSTKQEVKNYLIDQINSQ